MADLIDVPSQEPAQNMLAVIERAAMTKDVDVEKMRALLDMKKEIDAEQAKIAWINAMTRVQAEMPAVKKMADNKQTKSKYAKVEAIDKVLTPIYTKHGFNLTFGTADSIWADQGYIRIVGDVSHCAGHIRTYHYDLPPDDAGIQGTVNKTKVHASASTVTYGIRYLKALIFNIQFADDKDGNPEKEKISDKQAADLEALMDESIANKPKFLKWLGVESIADLDDAGYKRALEYCEKARKEGKKA